ncbi:MAG: PilW family protein [Candidatus Contendobacter sp.]
MDILNHYIRLAGYSTFPWDKALNISSNWNPATNERGFPPTANWPLAGQVIRGGESDVNGVDSIRIRYQGSNDGSITTCLGRAVGVNELTDITLSLTANDPVDGRSLQCTDNNTNTTQPLVAGLQDMQIWYGLSQGAAGMQANGRLTGVTAYVPANQVPAAQWDRVIGVRISLLTRSDQDRLTLAPQTIEFNDAPLAVADRRMRYVMGTTANVRNQSP